MNKPRVLLTYIESGMGHIMSMQAIASGLKAKYADEIEIIESYIMDEGDKDTEGFEKFLSNCTKETNKNKIFGVSIFWFLELVGKQHFMRLVHRTLFKKYTDATMQAMLKYNPDVIISTHYFITFTALELKKKYLPNLTVITYNPDNNVHVWWDNRSDLFINNNIEACNEAIRKREFKYDQIKRVFFTARDEVASSTGSKEDYRKKYNLPLDKFTVMIADGAYAAGKAKSVCNQLIRKIKFPITIIFLAGKNEKMYAYYEKRRAKMPKNITFVNLKFTPFAYEYYGASDIFITKSGPNAVLDSLFMGTPVIVDYYAHCIEKGTAKLFTEELKCGVTCYKLSHLSRQVIFMYEHPEFLAQLRKNIKKNVNKKQNGSSQIADIIIKELKEKELI
ncbi:MAG: hypothetical protein SOU19_03850 [Candidatus Caccosoma sp.]|nr:hypothetical protein [Candidatus Caccosoma sp.]